MMILMIILVIIPGLLVNRWLTIKEKQKQQRGFDIILKTDDEIKPPDDS